MLFASIAAYAFARRDNLSVLLFVAGSLALCCAVCFLKIPAHKAISKPHSPFRDSFNIFQDRIFAAILLLYSLIAIANQMTLPLRVEHLAKHRLGISHGTILAIFGVIQPLASIISGPLWGKLYDRVDLIAMRQCATACFLVGIPLFFATDNLATIYLASVLFGIGRSGGVIFWSLWTSAIAPRERVDEYMGQMRQSLGCATPLHPFSVTFYWNPRDHLWSVWWRLFFWFFPCSASNVFAAPTPMGGEFQPSESINYPP
jgi:MFS family permease